MRIVRRVDRYVKTGSTVKRRDILGDDPSRIDFGDSVLDDFDEFRLVDEGSSRAHRYSHYAAR